MATAGLSFENPLFRASSGVPAVVVNPYELRNPTAASGLDGLGGSATDIAAFGAKALESLSKSRFTLPEMKQPSLGYSPSRKEFFVQGTVFGEDDAQRALASEQLLGGAPTGLPQGDWVPLTTQQYGQYLQSIREPSLGTLASKGFGRGVDVTQMLVGRGLQLAGAEQLGGRIVAQQMEDLRKTSPYERQFTDISSGGDAVEWLVANAAQQGPNIIESIVTGALGFLAGTASSGTPIGGAAASVASVIGKEAWKNSVKEALKKRAAGEALSAAEQKTLRTAAGIGMATAASFGSGMATGAADIYGELRERGADANDVSARLVALAGSVPYAALDVMPEALLFSRLLGKGRPALSTLPTGRAKAGELLKRGAVGGGVGAAAEGTAEAAQEALLLGLSDQDLAAPENINRLINSFAAGAGVGGPVGAGVNIINPTNLLQPGAATQPVSTQQEVTPTLPANAVPGTQGELFPIAPGEMAGPAVSPLMRQDPAYAQQISAERQRLEAYIARLEQELQVLPDNENKLRQRLLTQQLRQQALNDLQRIDAELGQILPSTGITPPQPGQMALFEPTAPTIEERLQRGLMPPGPGMQGQLGLVGGAVAPGYVPPTVFAPEVPAAPGLTPEEAAAQGALQFAPPAPVVTGPTALSIALQQAQQAQQMQQMQQQRDAELAAQRESDLGRLANVAAAQRQLDLIPPPEAPPPAPMRPVQPRQPQQLPLFTRREAPVPPRAGQLRRGGRMQPAAAPAPVAPTTVLTAEVLDATGLPRNSKFYKALLGKDMANPQDQAEIAQVFAQIRSTPTLRKSIKDAVEQLAMRAFNALATQGELDLAPAAPTPPPRAKKEKPRAAQEGKLRQGRVTERAQDRTGVGARGDVGQKPTAQVPPSGGEAGGRGGALKRGPEPEKVEPPKPLKKEPPGPKAEAAPAAAPSAVPETLVPLTLERSDGTKLTIKDGRKYQAKLDADIKKYEDLLVCLRSSR